MRSALLLVVFLVACGPRTRIPDSGPEDSGVEDAGVDAGRARGEDPPTGWTVALPIPEDAGTLARYGVSASMALDQFGQPMIAALVVDPNSDAVAADNRLVFTRWDGVAKQWQAPVNIEIVGTIDVNHPNRQVSLARSPGGVIGIAYLNESGVVRYAHSENEGANFSQEVASAAVTDGSVLSNPVIAFSGETLHLAYVARPVCGAGACGKIIHRQRMPGDSPFGGDEEIQGALAARDWPFAMTVDPSGGGVAFAFFSDDMAGQVTLSSFIGGSLQPIDTSTVMVDAMSKIPSVSLSVQSGVARVAYHLLSATNADAQLWYAQKSSSAWSIPALLPRDGVTGMLDGTQWYQAIVAEGGSKVAIVANFSRAAAVGTLCGGPKLYRSADGVSFTMPCHPPESGGPTMHTLNQAGLWINMAAHKPGKLTIALDYEQRLNPLIGGGVIVYREP